MTQKRQPRSRENSWISGGESYEDSWNVNGIQAQDSWRATLEPVYVEDAVAEITTLTSGIPAEYGRFAGGTVHVVTKTGGNSFGGSIRSTLVNDAWSEATPAGEERTDDVTPVWEATLLLSTKSLGSHTIVGGAELFDASWKWNLYISGSGYTKIASGVLYEGAELYPVLGPWSFLSFQPVIAPTTGNSTKTWTTYLNDTWRLGSRLSFNLGLRWDQSDVRDPTGALQSSEGTLSPRLGVAWDPAGKRLFRLTAGWGLYVSTVNEWQLSWAYAPGRPAAFDTFFGGPPMNVDPGAPRVGIHEALRRMFGWERAATAFASLSKRARAFASAAR